MQHEDMINIPKLYHYTDKFGFIGMAENKTLWLTNVRYMNDPGEFIYGLDLVRNYIRDNYHESLGRFLNDAELRYEEIPSTFSFSLSENKDLLSQWRGYCHNGGVSISFDKQCLQTLIKENNLLIQRCLYDKTEIEEFIANKIVGMSPKDYQEKIIDNVFCNKQGERMPYNLVGSVFHNISFIKHEAYREEREWRIVYMDHYERPLSSLGEKVEYRNGPYGNIPYLELPLKDNFIAEAIFSPGNKDSELIEKANFLIRSDNVSLSTIPYRT